MLTLGGGSYEAILMKSEHVQKRYNRIKADQGNQAAENWLSMLIRSL